MRKVKGTICLGSVVLSLAYAGEASVAWAPLSAKYTIFSGPVLAGREAPTAKDRKLAIVVDGRAAKDIFDSVGPDVADRCSAQKGDRDRRREGIYCTYTAENAGLPKAYRCWVGIDLRTGEAGAFVSC